MIPRITVVLRPCVHQRAFSLVELVVVIVIIGIIAAIAVPRVARASRNATANALQATLASVREAIDHYQAEHQLFPGYDPSTFAPDGTWFVDQLTKYSGKGGKVSNKPTSTYIYGPYLGKPFPTNPFNDLSTVAVRKVRSDAVSLGSSGWIATLSDGSFIVNASTGEMSEVGIEGSVAEKVGGGALDGAK